MHINQLISVFPSNHFERVSNAIEASINHFKTVRKNIKRVSVLLQEDNSDEINTAFPDRYGGGHEPLWVNKINYIAILSLELLGITCPSQQRIEIMESLIWITLHTDKPIREIINRCLFKKACDSRLGSLSAFYTELK